jgi:hypothetical protein
MDALTFALAAGWYDESLGLLSIPSGVTIVGILSAGTGTGVFLDAYAPYWPREADALVLRHSDEAGSRWIQPQGFLDNLRSRCRRVECFHFGQHANGRKRDVNDLWREGLLTRAAIIDLLAEVGWAMEDCKFASPQVATNEAPAAGGEGNALWNLTPPSSEKIATEATTI